MFGVLCRCPFMNDIEPLDPQTWLQEIERILADRSCGRTSTEMLLRRVFYLVQLTPRALRGIVPLCLTEEQLDSWLVGKAELAAAYALFAPPTEVWIIREAASEPAKVRIKILGAPSPGEDSDTDPARALIGAWCQAVLTLQGHREGVLASIANCAHAIIEEGSPTQH